MVSFILDSGILALTFWAIGAALAVVIVHRLRPGKPADRHGADLFAAPVFVVILACGSLFNAGLGLYKGYVAPADYMQDVVSAREFLAGHSLYPPEKEMTRLITEAVHRDPPRYSLLAWSPALHQREARVREANIAEPWVQAHPPPMTLFFAPFVAALGIYGTFAAITALSLLAIAVSLVLVQRGLQLQLSFWASLSVGLFVMGSAPSVGAFRTAQTSWILATLLIGSWYCLLRGRPGVGGILAALAACLKVFPALVLVYLLLRQRRAFVWAAGTCVFVLTVVGLVCGFASYTEHFVTGRGVIAEYATYDSNLSLLGVFARALHWQVNSDEAVRVTAIVVVVVGVGLAGLVMVGPPRPRVDAPRDVTLSFCAFLALMPVLSPISWDQYLVVLFLPLAVMGQRALAPDASKRALAVYVVLLGLLALPSGTYRWVAELLQPWIGYATANLLILSLRTFLVAGIAVAFSAAVRLERHPPPGPVPPADR